ncbi:hypothetical protein SeLEV6574_g08056, partial [Synchytrium endobioticum]
MNLGYFEYSLNNFHVGLKYMRHALNRWEMLASGDKHPESAQADANIATILQKLKDLELSTCFFERACSTNEELLGRESILTAVSYQSLTKSYFLSGDYRKALASERAAFTFFKEKLGLNDVRTQESAALLRTITERAVVDAKREKEEMERAKKRQSQKQRSTATNGAEHNGVEAVSKGHLPVEELLKFIGGSAPNGGGKKKKRGGNSNSSSVGNGNGPHNEVEI